ncbi:hypothetical protein [Endozoicomonas sp. 4G]|uniref:hypothetical protein n=1 Tax=Endozoicomonas sp. 4G TaxID=2872754 RepID=UPI0020788E63|nr:hypothetical protein [Endozoicomonas sp. 4G]
MAVRIGWPTDFIKEKTIQLILLFSLTIPAGSQAIEIKEAILVRSTYDNLYLIITVREDQGYSFYHIYQLENRSGQYWGTHLQELDSFRINTRKQTVNIVSYGLPPSIPTSFSFVRWVTPDECNFR